MQADGGLVVDIRPAAQRAAEGELGFGLIVERNVLEWRFDLRGSHALPEVSGYDQPVVVVCSEGYASSLAAASLRRPGLRRRRRPDGGLPGLAALAGWHAARHHLGPLSGAAGESPSRHGPYTQ